LLTNKTYVLLPVAVHIHMYVCTLIRETSILSHWR